MTVTGQTLAENVKDLPGLKPGQQVIHPFTDPIKASGHIQICAETSRPRAPLRRSQARKGWSFQVPSKCV